MIQVVVTVECQEGQRDAFLEEFRKIIPQVHDEAGCIEYGPAIDISTNIETQAAARPDVVMILEKWESLEHLEAHLIAPHMLEYRPKVKPFVANSTIHILEPA